VITTWILLGLVWTSVAVGWYADHKWKKLLREQRALSIGWKELFRGERRNRKVWMKLCRNQEKLGKFWRDAFKGRPAVVPTLWTEGGTGESEAKVTTVDGDDAPTETMTEEEKP
jgi:hypothetical protein